MATIKVDHITNSEGTKNLLEKTKKGLGFIPNMYINMGKNEALLDSYVYAYQSFRVNAGFSPVEQEVVFLSVAYENNCEYCMAAHSFVGDKLSKVPTEVTDAIRNGSAIPDAKLAALSKLTRVLTGTRGNANQEDVNAFLKAGYNESHILGIITGIAIKTMSNYSNHITSPEVDAVFSARKWKK